jgi:hypothetical protein
MITDQDGRCKGVVDTEGQRLNTKWLVMEASFASEKLLPKNQPKRFTSRGVFITDRSILPSDSEHITLLSFPPGTNQSVPTSVFELAPMSMACPQGLYVVQVVAEGVTTPEADIKPVTDILFQPRNEEEHLDGDDRPVVLWDLYFEQLDTAGSDLGSRAPDNVFIVPGPVNELDFECCIREARRIFDLICPGEEFLPKAPNPEDIIWGDEGQERQEGGGFSEGDVEDAECDKTEPVVPPGPACEPEASAGHTECENSSLTSNQGQSSVTEPVTPELEGPVAPSAPDAPPVTELDPTRTSVES